MLQAGVGDLRLMRSSAWRPVSPFRCSKPASVTCVSRVEPSEVGQPLQMLQAGVGDLRAHEVQALEVGQPLQMLQAGVGDLRLAEVRPWRPVSPFRCSRPASVTCVREVQHLEVGQPLQVLQARAVTCVPLEGPLEAGQPLQVLQASIGDLCTFEVQVWRRVSPFRCSRPASVTVCR